MGGSLASTGRCNRIAPLNAPATRKHPAMTAVRQPRRQGVSQSAQRRRANGCDLVRPAGDGCALLQHAFRRHPGDESLRSRTLKSRGRAEHRRGRVDFNDVDPSREAAPGQKHRGDPLHEDAHLDHPLAWVAVRHMSRREGQQRRGDELNQAHQAQIKGAVRQARTPANPGPRHRSDTKIQRRPKPRKRTRTADDAANSRPCPQPAG